MSGPSQPEPVELTPRQRRVLSVLVSEYVASGSAVSSAAIARALPEPLSAASVRGVLGELAELGTVSKAHHSAGRVPTAEGLRLYVAVLAPTPVSARERAELAGALREEGGPEALMRTASRLLSEHSRQLGFVIAPRLDRVRLRRVSFVRLSRERLLALLVTRSGVVHQRVLDGAEPLGDQIELDRLARILEDRLGDRSLREAREGLAREARALRSRADRHVARAIELGLRAIPESAEPEDLVVATRLALLDQPELREPEALRRLLTTLEARQKIVQILDRMLDEEGVRVAFGTETDEPGLSPFALVAAPYGDARPPLGALGVIGPRRMDYARVIPLVGCLSHLVSESLRP